MLKTISYIWKSCILKIINRKLILCLIMMIVFVWSVTKPLRRYLITVQHPVSWCLYPFLICHYVILILFWFCVIYANSDVPFMQSINMYHVIRTGRKAWAAAQIVGIIFRSLLLTIGVALIAVLPVITRLDFVSGWGRVLHTLAMTDVASLYEFEYFFYYETFVKFTPVQLMVITLTITALCASFIGILMFLIALYISRPVSIAFATGEAIAFFFVINTPSIVRQKVAYFVPTVWPQVAQIATPQYGYYWLPPIIYMLVFLMSSIVIMSLIIMYKIDRVEFQWENEDI